MNDYHHIINNTTNNNFNNRLVIYGVGNTGKSVARYLISQERDIVSFIDHNATPHQHYLNIPVYKLEEFIQLYNASEFDLLIAIHNRNIDIKLLIENFSDLGFISLLNMIDYANTFPKDETFRYWLSPRSLYAKYHDKIRTLENLLADEESKDWLRRILQFRITGDYSLLPTPDFENQYSPHELKKWPNPLRLIDCGAYNGDTITHLLHQGYNIEKILAFEPDLENFEELAHKFSNIDHYYFPCGVSSCNCLVNFNAGSGEGSHQISEGGISVPMVRIDDIAPHFAPNLIKMDVEGGEFEALLGAKNTISNYKPGLAISLYHRPEDIFDLPLLIESWGLGYKFYIRGHQHSSFDSVLYAMQSSYTT